MRTVRTLFLIALSVSLIILTTACGSRPAAEPAPANNPASEAAAPTVTAAPAAPAAAPQPQSEPAQPKVQRTVKVTIPATGSDFVFLAVGRDAGIFAAEGLTVELEMAAPTVGIQAMVSGQFHFAGAVGSSLNASAKNVPIKTVLAIQAQPSYGFYANPPIRTVADLKGKNLGVTTLGSAAQILAEMVFEKHGLKPTDITWVPLSTADKVWPAIVGKAVDAGMVGSQFLVQAKESGLVDLGVYRDPASTTPSVGLSTTDKLLQQDPELVKAMIRGSLKSVQFMKSNKAKTVEIMTSFMRAPADEMGKLYDLTIDGFNTEGTLTDEQIKLSLEVLRRGLEVKEALSPAQIVDFSLTRQVAAELAKKP